MAVLLRLFLLLEATDFSNVVTSILDGDTLEALYNQHPERIRLHGVDCREKGQAYGQRARQATSALVFGNAVMLQAYGQDEYKRTVAGVIVPDGMNVNQECVKDG